jgi:tetratricopeptide (TPR) repeat protein
MPPGRNATADAADTGCVVSAQTVCDLLNEAGELRAADRVAEAAERYGRIVTLDPRCSEAWRSLAILAFKRGDRSLARTLVGHALLIDSRDAAAYRMLATLDEVEGNLPRAYAGYARALDLDPTQRAATIALARVSLALGHYEHARAVAERGAALGIVDAGLLRILGTARLHCGDDAAAESALRDSLRLERDPDAFAQLAGALLRLHRTADARAALAAAFELDPEHAVATLHLGVANYACEDFPAARAAFALAIARGCEDAHANLGRLELLLGNYARGFAHFGHDDRIRRALPVWTALPMWDGTPAPNASLLVWHEQGVGDTIQLVRFLRAARERTAKITLACPRETLDIFGSVDGVDAVLDMRERPVFDDFDCWLPTIRLPVIFDATPQSIPTAPYLHADPARRARYRPQLEVGDRLRVGLVWSGNPRYPRDDIRSCGLTALEPVAAVAGVAWYALQQGAARDERPRNGMELIPINTAVHDFADTAAIVSELDLTITVDTSVAHLAGALGREAWVMLPKICDWRWLLAGERSAWYPTLRLFRQTAAGDWTPVVAALAAALRARIAARA